MLLDISGSLIYLFVLDCVMPFLFQIICCRLQNLYSWNNVLHFAFDSKTESQPKTACEKYKALTTVIAITNCDLTILDGRWGREEQCFILFGIFLF